MSIAQNNDLTANTRKVYLVLLVIAGFFALLPILLAYQDIWDGMHVYEAVKLQNMAELKTWFFESRWTLQYYLYLATYYLQNITGVSYKIWTNILTCFVLVGICLETKRIFCEELRGETEFALLAVLVVLVFPPWATLMSSVLAFHITCVWLFLFSLRLYRQHKLFAVIPFVLSLSLNSVFAFAVGYALFDGMMTVDRESARSKLLRIALFSTCLLGLFVYYRTVFAPYGEYLGYNSYSPRWSSFLNYGVVVVLVAILGYCLYRVGKLYGAGKQMVRQLGGCLILLFFAGLAYWYVGKPIKVEGTNSFTPRQAYLAAVPISMLIGIVAQYGSKAIGRKITYGIVGLILTVSFCYQFAAYQQKYTQLLFENMFISLLEEGEEPLSGVVRIDVDYDLVPKYHRDFATTADWLFLEAYGRRDWSTVVRTKGKGRDISSSELQMLAQRAIDRQGLAPKDVHETVMDYSLDGFRPFGNPLYYYYYFAKDYERFNPRLSTLIVK